MTKHWCAWRYLQGKELHLHALPGRDGWILRSSWDTTEAERSEVFLRTGVERDLWHPSLNLGGGSWLVSCKKTPLLCLTLPSNPLAWGCRADCTAQPCALRLWNKDLSLGVWNLRAGKEAVLSPRGGAMPIERLPRCPHWAPPVGRELGCVALLQGGEQGGKAVHLWLSGLVPLSSVEPCAENNWSETKWDSSRPCSQGRGHLDPLSQLCQTCTLGESYLSARKLSHQLSWSFLLLLPMPFSLSVSIFWNSQSSPHSTAFWKFPRICIKCSLSISFINLGPSLC